MSLAHRRVVLVGVLVVLLLALAAFLVSATQGASTGGPSSGTEVLLSGAAGGVIVFVLATTAGVVVRTVHQGRELRGLSRVLLPEMDRNWLATGAIKASSKAKGDYPIREAWIDTRVRLSQLMREEDYRVLAKYYADLEELEAAVNRNDHIVGWYAGKAQDHESAAKRVVEGYCNARWQPFSYRPGPPDPPQ
jgi:hypothetical protein